MLKSRSSLQMIRTYIAKYRNTKVLTRTQMHPTKKGCLPKEGKTLHNYCNRFPIPTENKRPN